VVYLHTSFRETPEGGRGREWRAGEILGRGEGVGGNTAGHRLQGEIPQTVF